MKIAIERSHAPTLMALTHQSLPVLYRALYTPASEAAPR
jgi:hypothetical protein